MALTAFPTVVFNSSTGSDSVASGAGPATALFGSGEAVTSGASTTVTFTDSPDLSGVAQDGSHVLWLKGRGFYRISTVDNTAKTCVIEHAVNVSTPCDYAIGGKRATFDDTESRKLFLATVVGVAADSGTGGVSPRWVIRTETDQNTTSLITCSFATGGSLSPVIIEGDSTTTRRVITQTGNSNTFYSTAVHNITFKNLKFLTSHATKNYVFITNQSVYVTFDNCVIGDTSGTNCPKGACTNTAEAPTSMFINSAVIKVTEHGVLGTNGSFAVWALGTLFIGCTGRGIYGSSTSNGGLRLDHCIFSRNGSHGIEMPSIAGIMVKNCTFDNNIGDGLRLVNNNYAEYRVSLINNQFTNNGIYGINLTGSTPHYIICEYNNFYLNASGTVNGFTLSSSNLTTNPNYTDNSASVQDFSVGTVMKAVGFPNSTLFLGANQYNTKSYVDIGAAQRQEIGGVGAIIGRGGLIG